MFTLKFSSPPNQYSIYSKLTGLWLSRDAALSLLSVCLFHFTSLHFLCFIHFCAASFSDSSYLSSVAIFHPFPLPLIDYSLFCECHRLCPSLQFRHLFCIFLQYLECLPVFLYSPARPLLVSIRPACLREARSSCIKHFPFPPTEPRQFLRCSRREGQNDLITLCH